MAKKTTTARGKRSSQRSSDAKTTESNRSDVKREDKAERDAPIEHDHGEPKREERAGSLEDETLDRSAPFNKTYGRQK